MGGFVSAAEIKRLRAARTAAEKQLDELMAWPTVGLPDLPEQAFFDNGDTNEEYFRISKAQTAHEAKVIKENQEAGHVWSERPGLSLSGSAQRYFGFAQSGFSGSSWQRTRWCRRMISRRWVHARRTASPCTGEPEEARAPVLCVHAASMTRYIFAVPGAPTMRRSVSCTSTSWASGLVGASPAHVAANAAADLSKIFHSGPSSNSTTWSPSL